MLQSQAGPVVKDRFKEAALLASKMVCFLVGFVSAFSI